MRKLINKITNKSTWRQSETDPNQLTPQQQEFFGRPIPAADRDENGLPLLADPDSDEQNGESTASESSESDKTTESHVTDTIEPLSAGPSSLGSDEHPPFAESSNEGSLHNFPSDDRPVSLGSCSDPTLGTSPTPDQLYAAKNPEERVCPLNGKHCRGAEQGCQDPFHCSGN